MTVSTGEKINIEEYAIQIIRESFPNYTVQELQEMSDNQFTKILIDAIQ